MERERIRLVIAHIERHLTEPLDNAALAAVAGYSEYHFLRIFRRLTGLTPTDYLRKRRMTEIVRRIGGSRTMAEVAFAFGFNSKENFTRAFVREHGILPSHFRQTDCSLRLYEPFSFSGDAPVPAVSLSHVTPFTVLALPSDTPEPPRFWNRRNAGGYSRRLTGGAIVPDWGVMRRSAATGRLDYWIGVREEHAHGNTTGTERLAISGGLYAAIHRTWDWIYDCWLPASPYRRAPGFEMECYTETDRTYTERIFIPLERKDSNG